MNILIIALSGIGDALMFTPALQQLNEEIPSANIEALVMYNGVKDIYEKLPQLSKVHYFDFLNSTKLDSLRFVLKLRNKYQASVNVYPSNRKEYNIIARIIGAEKRIAIKYLRNDLANLGFLNTLQILEDDNLHNVEENVRMAELLAGKKLRNIPPLLFNMQNDDQEFMNGFLVEKSIQKNDIVIGFHPGCSSLKNHNNRRWEPNNFAELGKRLIEKFNARILVFGGSDEEVLKNTITVNIDSPYAHAVNGATLSNTAAVMSRCNLFITNDSSLMHAASALKLNVLAIIGPTNTNYIHPWQTDHQIASLNLECSPCFYYSPRPLICSRTDVKFKCVKELSVEMVFGKAEQIIKKLRVE
ncbi:glycosyltransferase family 9 protein [bacterium]|nr:glycosyltransferase family 9 protein [bacterium]